VSGGWYGLVSLDLKQVPEYFGQAVKDPPAFTALLTVLVAGVVAGYFVATLVDAGTRTALQTSLDSQREVYSQRLTGIQQDWEQRLKAKDDLLDDYRRRLQIVAPKGGELAQLTNRELKVRALQFVSELRKWNIEAGRDERERGDQTWSKMKDANNDEERARIMQEMMKISSERTSYYLNNFRVTAVLLRNEISNRLPPRHLNQAEEGVPYNIYETPITTFGYNYVMTNLEMLAKSLD
jgi:uncharacterized membrane-anchored protein YhcB (DUF1043 family)